MNKKNSKLISGISGFCVVLVALLVHFGWLTHNLKFIQILPNLVPMQFNTALGFLVFGITIIILTLGKNQWIGLVLAFFGGTIGLLTLMEYLFNINIGLDELFIEHYITVETSHPGRMAPNTALCFVLSGLSTFFLSFRKKSSFQLSGILGSMIFGLGLVALVGYAIGVESIYGWGAYTRMAIHTALGFMLLGVAFTVLNRIRMKEAKQKHGYDFPSWLLGYAIVYSITIFLIDEQFPLGFSADSGYIALVLFGWFIANPKTTLYLAGYGTLLIILGYFISSEGSIDSWMALANRIFTLLLIWLVALLLFRIKKKEILLKQSNEELDNSLKEIQEKNKVLEEFTYIASHDLQEPLRTVTSFAELLSDNYHDKLDEQGQKSLQYIQDSTQRMSRLITGLLDYTRLGRSEEVKTVNIEKIIHEIEQDLSLLINNTKAEIQIDSLPTIRCFEIEIRLLFQNLITNGIKFRSKDTTPQIVISSRHEPELNQWRFFVKDNGIGIKEEHKTRIFSMFQKLNTRSEFEGTGIGLAHCKKIVSVHGGEIEVKSTLGKGCTFCFTISDKLL